MPRAQRAIDKAVDFWLTKHTKSDANAIKMALKRGFDLLIAHHEAGPQAEDLGVRHLFLFEIDYWIFYRHRPRARRLEIVAFRYGGQLPLKRL